MRQVMLVDDEYYFRKALRASIPWEENGFCVCGEAADGEDALEKMKGLCPDVALVDITMPHMDGLALSRRIRDQKLPVKIVILSGHNEFEYARQAVSLGVNRYLLKPVDDDELMQTLGELRQELDQEEQQRREAEGWKRQARGRLPVGREMPVAGLLTTALRTSLFMHLRTLSRKEARHIIAACFENARKGQAESALLPAFCTDVGLLCAELLAERDRLDPEAAVRAPHALARQMERLLPLESPEEMEDWTKDTIGLTMDALAAGRRSKSESLVHAIREFVGSHYTDEHLDIDMLVRRLYVHYSHLCHVFKRETGMTINEYITSVRMEQAKALFDAGSRMVLDVAGRVGIPDANYFGKLFKRQYGHSPRRYLETLP